MDARQKILRLIGEKRLSRTAVAKAAGVAYNTFRSYLDAKTPSTPGSDVGVRIANYLEVPPGWLWDENLDWPPQERSGLASYSDLEVVEDLARRRNLVFRDMIVVKKKLRRDHLEAVEAIARKRAADRSTEEAAALSNCLRDLNQLSSFSSRMSWLDPDDVHPPEDVDSDTYVSLIALPTLQKVLDSYQSRVARESPAFLTVPANERPEPGQVFFHPGFGHIATYDDLMADMARHRWWEWIPLVEDRRLLPPTRCDDGRSSRELGDSMVRYTSADPRVFALKLPAESATDDCPAGTVIVCEPNKELNPIDRCVLVPSQSGGDLRIVLGEAVLSERPEYRSAAERLRANAGVYPIVATYKPGAGIPEGTHV